MLSNGNIDYVHLARYEMFSRTYAVFRKTYKHCTLAPKRCFKTKTISVTFILYSRRIMSWITYGEVFNTSLLHKCDYCSIRFFDIKTSNEQLLHAVWGCFYDLSQSHIGYICSFFVHTFAWYVFLSHRFEKICTYAFCIHNLLQRDLLAVLPFLFQDIPTIIEKKWLHSCLWHKRW